MTVISKELFYGTKVTCKDIHQWSESCVKANAYLSCHVFLGTLKFFAPFYILQTILNYKKLDKDYWKELFKSVLRSGMYGIVNGLLFLGTNCVVCCISDNIYYYNTGGILSGASLLLESPANRKLGSLLYLNLLTEALFNNLTYYDIIKFTRGKQTLLFMGVSSMLMYLLKYRKEKKKLSYFWFFTPPSIPTVNLGNSENHNSKECSFHTETCLNYCYQGFKNYFLVSYAFSVLKTAIPKLVTLLLKPQGFLRLFLEKDNLLFGLFVGSYVAVYRYLACYFLRKNKTEKIWHTILAGFICGIPYALKPDLQIMSLGVTSILQIVWCKIEAKCQWTEKIPEKASILFMLCNALLIQNRLTQFPTCPKSYVKVLDLCTNGLMDGMYNNLLKKLLL